MKEKIEEKNIGLAISKRLKISKAQQQMMVAAGVASVILGATVVLCIHFIKYISFNTGVIDAKNEAITNYSDAIKNSGTCKSPKGTIYTSDELKKCSPNDIDAEEVPGTLRYNVLVEMAQNTNLESVAREDTLSVCKNADTGKKYTYDELLGKYEVAVEESERSYYLSAIRICSALRAIPDALPTSRNDEALLASLNQIFILSNWIPDSLAPNNGGTLTSAGLSTIPVSLLVETDGETTRKVLSNIEKSIREFSITNATIEWSGSNLNLNATANAYYLDPEYMSAYSIETDETIKATNKKGNQ